MEGSQEGSPWSNDDIFRITKSLNRSLDTAHLNSKILLTEAGMLTYLYGGKTAASRQTQEFFDPRSRLFVGALSHVPKVIGGHSYFTESDDSTLRATRQQVADTSRRYGVNYWETEYSMLGDGYKDGAKGKISAMDCALFLAKVIHTDLTAGNATAWQFWNSYEPGSADFDTRYYLIALKPNTDFKNGEFTMTKNLWALGSYSRFIRPGMQRVIISNKDNADNSKLLISAYTDKNNKLVIVGINYGTGSVNTNLELLHGKKKYKKMSIYLTAAGADLNMKASGTKPYHKQVELPARSISTIVLE
jgi:O-glycosyl hydrolase